MIVNLLENVNQIYIAYGATDFRKQISALCNIVKNNFGENPYNGSAYIFCNKKRNSIKVLCYDKNGFVLAQKSLLNINKVKFKWPRNSNELKNISKQQLTWLLSGLELEPKSSFKDVVINLENTAS